MRSLIRRLVHFVRPSMRNGSLTEGHELVAGDVVTVTCDDGLFGVMKVLAVDGHGVHARLYVQRFDRRPITAGLGELSTAPFGPDYDNPLSIGHMPLTSPVGNPRASIGSRYWKGSSRGTGCGKRPMAAISVSLR